MHRTYRRIYAMETAPNVSSEYAVIAVRGNETSPQRLKVIRKCHRTTAATLNIT